MFRSMCNDIFLFVFLFVYSSRTHVIEIVVYLSGKRGGADVLEEKTTFITACIAITIATVTRSLGAPDVEEKKPMFRE